MKNLILICLFISGIGLVRGQGKTVPSTERLYVHQSATLLFTGEYLYYKLYCLDTATNKLSKLSKFVYVELVSEDLQRQLIQKVTLEDGMGFSDFFIPNSIPSGNYKLIAYTNWMKNFGIENFFQSDISIVNPYRVDQSAILGYEGALPQLDLARTSEELLLINEKDQDEFAPFKLRFQKRDFKKREKIRFIVQNNIRERGMGTYSVSVRKLDALPAIPRRSAVQYRSGAKASAALDTVLFSPETDGYFLSGRISNTQSGLKTSQIDVALSVPGPDFIFKVTSTDKNGRFRFILDEHIVPETAVLQVLGNNKSLFTIELDNLPELDYSSVSFGDFKIDSTMEEAIVTRSVYNQIENGYFSIKPDTVRSIIPDKSFIYYEKDITYNLDDYKRFSTMEEVFTEIVKAVWTARDEFGNKVVRVFHREFATPTENPPLLFIDGVYIQEHEDLLGFPADKVQQIRVVRNQYKFGAREYQGVLLVETIEGNYKSDRTASFIVEHSLFKSRPQKSYYKQRYKEKTDEADSRIPDFRTQLLWEPDVVLKRSEMQLECFASDNTGYFEVVLEGFTLDGSPVSLREIIRILD